MKKLLKILFLVAILALAYLCIVYIIIPIRFSEEKKARDAAMMQCLMEIKKAQQTYYNTYGEYAADMDMLIEKKIIPDSACFIPGTEMRIEMAIGTEEKTTHEKLTFEQYGELPIGDSIRTILARNVRSKTALDLFKVASMFPIKQPDGVFREFADSFFNADMGNKQGIREIERFSRSVSEICIIQAPYQLYLRGLNKGEIKRLKQKAEKAGQYPGLQLRETNEPIVISTEK